MARTNKTWIAKIKKQKQKQRKILNNNRKISKEQVKRMWNEELKNLWLLIVKENNKWNSYERIKLWKKYWCITTKMREDQDGYRIIKNKWNYEFKYMWKQSWAYRKWLKKQKK